jgi:two-component system sensor histidine kinase KdpD
VPIAERDRPDPDTLLAQLQQEEAQAKRGKLRIYFGASAGVGKTYAMLVAARKLTEEGRDVVVGVVETHGRSETAALLEGLPVLPPKELEYKGNRLKEFDLDAAIARHPELILVDELAHTNVQGSRHPKRWQDVEELLASGIDVFTTLNVQHLESLNDVVGGITGIRVWETLPDTFFDRADEVMLCDIPADELLGRANVDAFFLEYDSERAGDFAPLRFMPEDKAVVLGLVSSKTPALEPIDGLLKRLDAASRHVPMDRLAVSPQCGFGTTVGGAPMTEDDEKRKLALVGEVARRAWG